MAILGFLVYNFGLNLSLCSIWLCLWNLMKIMSKWIMS